MRPQGSVLMLPHAENPRSPDGDGDRGAAYGASGRPDEPPVDAGSVEGVAAGGQSAPPLAGARGLEADGAEPRRGGGGGGSVARGVGEAGEEAEVGGREADAGEQRRRRGRGGAGVGRHAVPASVVSEGARGDEEREQEDGRGRGEEEEERERGGHHGRLHAQGEEARPGARAAAALGDVPMVGSLRRAGGGGRGPAGGGGRSHWFRGGSDVFGLVLALAWLSGQDGSAGWGWGNSVGGGYFWELGTGKIGRAHV